MHNSTSAPADAFSTSGTSPTLDQTFGRWLRDQKRRNDPVGDLARDVLAEVSEAATLPTYDYRFDVSAGGVKPLTRYRLARLSADALRRHLTDIDAAPGVMHALDLAVAGFIDEGAGPRRQVMLQGFLVDPLHIVMWADAELAETGERVRLFRWWVDSDNFWSDPEVWPAHTHPVTACGNSQMVHLSEAAERATGCSETLGEFWQAFSWVDTWTYEHDPKHVSYYSDECDICVRQRAAEEADDE